MDRDDRAEVSAAASNARLGLGLFFVYLVLYGGFIAMNTFAPQTMARPVVEGINLAVFYGFGLIAAALVLALVYMALCKRADDAEGRA